MPPGYDDEGDAGGHEDCLTQDHAIKAFELGLQAMRETIAAKLEVTGEPTLARLVRDVWNPDWGTDPGTPKEISTSWDDCLL